MPEQHLSPSSVEALSRRQWDAYRSSPVAPLRGRPQPEDAADAYAVQQANTRFWQSGGQRLAGRKIGFTARAGLAQLKVDQPDFGTWFADVATAHGKFRIPHWFSSPGQRWRWSSLVTSTDP